MDIFEEENILERAVILGQKLRVRLEKWQKQFPIVGEIRGLGAMLGLELKESGLTSGADLAKQLASYCFQNGLIILTCGCYGNIIRILTPFVITDDQLEKGLSIMEAGLAQISTSL